MNNYLVSARKYRPTTFQSVVGQKSLTTTLKNAISSGKLAHAYLFCGPRGVGKTTCARIFAKTINCLHPTDQGEACNTCESCTAMNQQRSFNIHELDAASNNSVEDIRTLIEQVRIPPQIGAYKVYIIDEVHMLSTSAFNAFLKTLEEPPHHAIFILATTEKHKVLPTILSRCQIYDFSRITIADIVEHLKHVAEQEGIVAEEDALHVIAQKADGGMRDALSIFDQISSFSQGNITYASVIENLNVLDYAHYFQLTDAIIKHQVVDSWQIVNNILNQGFDGQNFLTGLASHFRNLLFGKHEQTAQLLEVGASIRQRYIDVAKQCDNEFLYFALETTNQSDMQYKLSRNKRLLIDLLCVHLCQYKASNQETSDEKKKQIQPIAPVSTNRQVAPGSSTPEKAHTPPAPKPQVSPAPHKKISRNVGISIASLSQPQEPRTSSTQATIQPQEKTPFTQEELRTQWNTYITNHIAPEEVWLKQTMLQVTPSLQEEHTFEVVVNNPGQKERLEQHATNIVTHLRQALRNYTLCMNIRISENNEKKLAFTAEEKFRMMAEQNSSLLQLQKIFNLEIE